MGSRIATMDLGAYVHGNRVTDGGLALLADVFRSTVISYASGKYLPIKFSGVGGTSITHRNGTSPFLGIVTLYNEFLGMERYGRGVQGLSEINQREVDGNNPAFRVSEAARVLLKDPVIDAYICGLVSGADTVYPSHFYANPRIREESELAVASAGAFGRKTSKELKDIEDGLLGAMRYAEPFTFHESALSLYQRSKSADAALADAPPLNTGDFRHPKRFELFEHRLFEAIRKGNFAIPNDKRHEPLNMFLRKFVE